ncbi:MAG: hypothetical protein R2711_07815 [Acidimicrobiales bacterium]
MSVRRRAAGLLLALALACAGAVGPAGAERRSDAAGWRTYRPPTDGAVLDPFRPPPQPWLAGNRGIEYRPSREPTWWPSARGPSPSPGRWPDAWS